MRISRLLWFGFRFICMSLLTYYQLEEVCIKEYQTLASEMHDLQIPTACTGLRLQWILIPLISLFLLQYVHIHIRNINYFLTLSRKSHILSVFFLKEVNFKNDTHKPLQQPAHHNNSKGVVAACVLWR